MTKSQKKDYLEAIKQQHQIASTPDVDERIHYALTVTFTQPRNRKRDEIELHNVMKKLTDLMCETFIAKRRRKHYKYFNSFIITAIIEKKSYADAEPYPHVHALLSVKEEFAPKVDSYCGTNTLKQLPRIDRVLPKTIRTSDLQRAINSEKSHSVDKWINYFLKYHSVDDPVLMFKL